MFVQQYKGVILLLVVFLGSLWAVNNPPEQDISEKSQLAEHVADHFVVAYNKVEMDESGFPASKLIAEFAAHYIDNDETELTSPVLTLFKSESPPWVMRSRTGVIKAGGDKIFLAGKVYINRTGSESVREVNIKTSELHIEPKRNYAQTEAWAELVSGLDTISGVGMKLYYQDPLSIELLANVKGQHVYK